MKKLSMGRCGIANSKQSIKKDSLEVIKPIPKIKITEKIPIYRSSMIIDPRYTERIIYESYKVNNVDSMNEYINFILSFRLILPNKISSITENQNNELNKSSEEILDSVNLDKDIKDYYNTEIKSDLPTHISYLFY